MQTEKIKVVIDAEGGTKVSVEGCPGPGCQDLTRALEASLGGVSDRKPTAEASQPARAARANPAG